MRLLDLREDNQVIWARRFDRPSDDLLIVQEEISSEVAAQIDPVMLLTEARRGSAYAVVPTSAYDHILRSVPLITRLERKGFMTARDHLAQAIVAEPDHSAAHVWFSVWHILLLSQGWADHPGEAAARARELAERSIVLDPYSAGAFSVAGHVRAFIDRNPLEAVVLHDRALELNPNLAPAVALSAITRIVLGETGKAEQMYQRYKTLSPLDPYSFLFDGMFAFFHLLKRDYLAAAALGRAVTQLNPGYTTGYKPYLAALGHLGREQEAAVVLRRLLTIEPEITVAECLGAFPLVRTEDRANFAEGLRMAGID